MSVRANFLRRSDGEIMKENSITAATNIAEVYKEMTQKIVETFASGGSGWIFQNVEKLFLKVDKFNPLNGEGYIDLPQAVKTKKKLLM